MDFDSGEVLTYTGVGGGIDAAIATRRVQAMISANYQHRVGWNDRLADDDVISGLAAVHVDAVPGLLAFDAGAMAARTHADIRFPVPTARTIDSEGIAEVYSAYAGPTLSTRAGPVAVNASLPPRLRQGRRPQPRRHRPSARRAADRPLFELAPSTTPPSASEWRRASCRSAGPSAPATSART